MAMRKKTKEALTVAAVTLAVVAVMLPGTFGWAKAKLFGDSNEKKAADDWGKKTAETFKDA